MSTVTEIKNWVTGAKQDGYKYVIIACDTFDYDDYPIFCKTDKECLEKYDSHNGKNMQTIMEVYDLSKDIKEQLNPGKRVFNLPKRSKK